MENRPRSRLEALFAKLCKCSRRRRFERGFARFQMAFDILSQDVAFQVYGIARFSIAQIGVFVGIGYDCYFRDGMAPARDRQTDAIDGNRPFRHNVARKLFRHLHTVLPTIAFGPQMRDSADPIHVAENEVPAKFLSRGKRLLQIDARANPQASVARSERSAARSLSR